MNNMIEISHVSKQYRLGAIGGTTLRAEIQSAVARMQGREDPNSKLDAKQVGSNKRFYALDDVSFDVRPGEAVGIIGHNGAGKSTLLKLVSRVTAPTKGEIRLRGRVASMLEVGTGFHPELTGRENVYLNGAILGMSKAEITRKFDQIVEFAEMGQFIDTPVKRYSSGMYVKLAFAVAAHLDSEIMIMDEVLAVGDAKFQKKCLDKMDEEANSAGRTILYVSHNMNTIQRLCTRVIVLEKGKLIYDGDTPGGVGKYLSVNRTDAINRDLRDIERHRMCKMRVKMLDAWLIDKANNIFLQDDTVRFSIHWITNTDVRDLTMNVFVRHLGAATVGFSSVAFGSLSKGKEYNTQVALSLKNIVPGSFIICVQFHEIDASGSAVFDDSIDPLFEIVIMENQNKIISYNGIIDNTMKMNWAYNEYGSVRLAMDIIENTAVISQD